MGLSSKLLSSEAVEALKKGKNLLAFSAGVDSTALFFLLEEAGITFDIAMVDYNTRAQSKKESAYAQKLAQTYGKTLYHNSIHLPPANFEHEARKHRYHFFETLIHQHHYDHLITAHQLNDRLEWFLMQLSKGAGLVEMLGFETIEKREGYRLIRPLIESDKKSLRAYLDYHDRDYFIDESNLDTQYKRNFIRKEFSEKFLKNYQEGVKKSFRYLLEDKHALFSDELLYHDKELRVLKRTSSAVRSIDKVCKEMGYLLSAAQKKQITQTKALVVGDKIAICFEEAYIFIAPYTKVSMDKKFKEQCRLLKIPEKIRPYLYLSHINPSDLQHFVKVS